MAYLKDEYQHLMKRNAKLSQPLKPEEIDLDKSFRSKMEALRVEKIAQTNRELAWTSEKHRLGMQKLKDFYYEGLVTDNIAVHALRSGLTVETFRVRQLSKHVMETADQVQAEIDKQEELLQAENRRKEEAAREE